MRALDIHKQNKEQPFVLLRMYLTDGSHFDIRHPEMITVTRTVLGITIRGRRGNSLPERMILCDPMHVVRLEPVDGKRTAN